MKFSAQPIAFFLLSSAGLVGAENLRSPAAAEKRVDFIDKALSRKLSTEHCRYWDHLDPANYTQTDKECIRDVYERTNYVFVTNKTFEVGADRGYDEELPAFDSIDKAHLRCKEAAELSGNAMLANKGFRAWISNDHESPLHFLGRFGKYHTLNEAEVAASFECLVDGDVYSRINIDENGDEVEPGTSVWTGTKENGEATAENCNNWGSASGTLYGTIGNHALRQKWSDGGVARCGQERRLYCFESPDDIDNYITDGGDYTSETDIVHASHYVYFTSGAEVTYENVMVPTGDSAYKYSFMAYYTKLYEGSCTWIDVWVGAVGAEKNLVGRIYLEDTYGKFKGGRAKKIDGINSNFNRAVRDAIGDAESGSVDITLKVTSCIDNADLPLVMGLDYFAIALRDTSQHDSMEDVCGVEPPSAECDIGCPAGTS